MSDSCIAAVTLGPGETEVREFPLPQIGEEDGLLKLEACGVCGSDWPFYAGIQQGLEAQGPPQPRIQGHHNIGRIAKVGKEAAKRWGVTEGDRVAVEEFIPCGHCSMCLTGNYRLCDASDTMLGAPGTYLRYGAVPTSVSPSLWGGYSEYQYLHPNSILYKIADHVPAEMGPLFIPIANGIRWMCEVGGAGIGSTVVIQGPGQHGLGCVVAAKEAGASCIIVTGLTKDARRFEVARSLGADYTIDVQREDVIERVREITGGALADVVVDVSAGTTEPLTLALELARKLGIVILAGQKHSPVPNFDSMSIYRRELTVRGVRGHDLRSVVPAIKVIESGKYPLERMLTHLYSLDEVGQALSTIGGQGDSDSIHLSVMPVLERSPNSQLEVDGDGRTRIRKRHE
jgi:threonine dehydrogenase-like Zn-dependent dehydrogenase